MQHLLKPFLLLLVFIFSSTLAFSQSKNYLDILSDKACSCFSAAMKESNGNKQAMNIKVGACMMTAAQPYHAQLKKDHGIDLLGGKNSTIEGEKLGRLVAMRMVTQCPEVLMTLADQKNESSEEPVEAAAKTFEGKVVAIQDQLFVVYTVKNAAGKSNNFIWLNFFESTPTLTNNYNQLLNKQIKITYTEQEFFDPRIKEFKNFNVITELTDL